MIDYKSLKALPTNWTMQDSDIFTMQSISNREPFRMSYLQFKEILLTIIPPSEDIPISGTVNPVTGNIAFADDIKLISSSESENYIQLNTTGENGINTIKINSIYLELLSSGNTAVKVTDGNDYSQLFLNTTEAFIEASTGSGESGIISVSGGFASLSVSESGDRFSGINSNLTGITLGTNAGAIQLTSAVSGVSDGNTTITTIDQAAGSYIITLNKNGISLDTLGTGLRIKNGVNGMAHRAVLVAGTVTIANNKITLASNVLAFCQIPGGTPGFLRCSARVVGTSFTILSSSATDTSTIYWKIEEPA